MMAETAVEEENRDKYVLENTLNGTCIPLVLHCH